MPSDIKHEAWVLDAAEQNMNLKENQNEAFYDSKSLGKEADPLAFEGKEVRHVNGSGKNNDPVEFEVNGEGDWNIKAVGDLSNNCESGRLDSPRKYSEAKDVKLQSHPALEQSKESESKDPGSRQMDISGTFDRNADFCTDKNVLEFESPEVIVRDKEINCHVVKDICIDEGMPAKEKFLVESCNDDQSGTNGDISNVFATSNGLEVASLKDTSIGEKEREKIGVSYDELLAQCRSKLHSENMSDRDTKNCDMKNSMQIGETDSASNVSKEESYVDRKLPFQEFGTRGFLRSFLRSLDEEGNKAVEPHDETFSRKDASEIWEPLSAEAEAREDIKPDRIFVDDKPEGGSVTFNFNSPARMVQKITDGQPEEQSVETGNDHTDTDGNANNIDTQCTSINDKATEDVEQAINEDNGVSLKAVQRVGGKDVKSENSHDGEAMEGNVIKHGHKNSDEVSVVSQLQHDEGESSFTAAGLITYSGPIAYSGSLSLRSDGSATSGRSFAFPVLQSEWNSSPVRMAKADRRHFRKHKGWRSGLLCCRF